MIKQLSPTVQIHEPLRSKRSIDQPCVTNAVNLRGRWFARVWIRSHPRLGHFSVGHSLLSDRSKVIVGGGAGNGRGISLVVRRGRWTLLTLVNR